MTDPNDTMTFDDRVREALKAKPPRELSSSETYTMLRDRWSDVQRVLKATPRQMMSRPRSCETAIAGALVRLMELEDVFADLHAAAEWLAWRLDCYGKSPRGRSAYRLDLINWLSEREYENPNESWDKGEGRAPVNDKYDRVAEEQRAESEANRAELAMIKAEKEKREEWRAVYEKDPGEIVVHQSASGDRYEWTGGPIAAVTEEFIDTFGEGVPWKFKLGPFDPFRRVSYVRKVEDGGES